MAATKKQVIENGKLVARRERNDGDENCYYLLGKNLYCLTYNHDGYLVNFWYMGYAKRAARDYCIDLKED
jgi:hypothetical protein